MSVRLSSPLPAVKLTAPAAANDDLQWRSQARTRIQSQPAHEPASRLRVLLVDDDAAIRRVMGQVVERIAGTRFSMVVAPSGPDGLALLGSELFDVIVSDLCMPGMDGVTFLSRARALQPNAERVLMTGYAELDAAVRAINDAHVTRLLAKPLGSRELIGVLDELAARIRERMTTEALEHSVRVQNHELASINRRLGGLVAERTTALLDGLLSALDYRDTETQWHSRRVALFTRTLALRLGVTDPDQLAVLELGALLHDVGKIGIPDAIMLKPGKLTEHEWAVMRRHPELGYELLAGIDFLSEARQLVLEHHERWDGRGYPGGLSGECVSLGARLFAVADTLDAMTSDRPYRKALSFEAAYAEIVAHAGSQFDPTVVAAFQSLAPAQWRAALAVGHARERGRTLSEAEREVFEHSPFGEAMRGAGEQLSCLLL